MTKADFWRSAGMHLLERSPEGWLRITADFLRAYYTRPEMHPIEASCAQELALHERLMQDPLRTVTEHELSALADGEVAENYRMVLAYRDVLLAAGTIEGAYLNIMTGSGPTLAPLFIDQMVHLIVRNILETCSDPLRVRTAELFFREQSASTEDARLMLADQEIIEMHMRHGQEAPPGELISAPIPRSVTLDVLNEHNKHMYWMRSDRFDTVIDFRFGQPCPDALARVIEAWLKHLINIEVRVEPRARIDDPDWRWHVGLDREATRLLNGLYQGHAIPPEELSRIVALFSLRICDPRLVVEGMGDKPVHLALAMDAQKRVKMKPQNLLTNLPLRPME